jgi:hypothetical protein
MDGGGPQRGKKGPSQKNLQKWQKKRGQKPPKVLKSRKLNVGVVSRGGSFFEAFYSSTAQVGGKRVDQHHALDHLMPQLQAYQYFYYQSSHSNIHLGH